MNKIVKVHSYMRSGTNFLIYALYENFYKNNLNIKYNYSANSINDLNNYYSKFDDSGNNLNNNAMCLFGDHRMFSGNTLNKIYIMRNPYDCLYSLYKLETSQESVSWYNKINKNISYENWLTDNKISYWKEHILSYMKAGCFIVKYEDLKNSYLTEMQRIANNFNLKFISKNIVHIDKQVGWIPKGNKVKYDLQTIRNKLLFHLNESFMSYTI